MELLSDGVPSEWLPCYRLVLEYVRGAISCHFFFLSPDFGKRFELTTSVSDISTCVMLLDLCWWRGTWWTPEFQKKKDVHNVWEGGLRYSETISVLLLLFRWVHWESRSKCGARNMVNKANNRSSWERNYQVEQSEVYGDACIGWHNIACGIALSIPWSGQRGGKFEIPDRRRRACDHGDNEDVNSWVISWLPPPGWQRWHDWKRFSGLQKIFI